MIVNNFVVFIILHFRVASVKFTGGFRPTATNFFLQLRACSYESLTGIV